MLQWPPDRFAVIEVHTGQLDPHLMWKVEVKPPFMRRG